MPRFFFNVRDHQDILDPEGVELSGRQEARAQAVVACGEMLRDLGDEFWGEAEWRMWVTDDAGKTVCALRVVSEADRG